MLNRDGKNRVSSEQSRFGNAWRSKILSLGSKATPHVRTRHGTEGKGFALSTVCANVGTAMSQGWWWFERDGWGGQLHIERQCRNKRDSQYEEAKIWKIWLMMIVLLMYVEIDADVVYDWRRSTIPTGKRWIEADIGVYTYPKDKLPAVSPRTTWYSMFVDIRDGFSELGIRYGYCSSRFFWHRGRLTTDVMKPDDILIEWAIWLRRRDCEEQIPRMYPADVADMAKRWKDPKNRIWLW